MSKLKKRLGMEPDTDRRAQTSDKKMKVWNTKFVCTILKASKQYKHIFTHILQMFNHNAINKGKINLI